MIKLLILATLATGSSAQMITPEPGKYVNCTGPYSKINSTDGLYRELLPRVVTLTDSNATVIIKRVFINYLTRTPIFLEMIHCNGSVYSRYRLLQEDEDGDDEGGGGNGGGIGGAAGALGALTGTNANPLDNTNVLNGVRRILANVFTGNLIGVIQESVGLRSPEPVSTVFTDVLSTLFGSQATAGITGVIGNLTSTPSSLNVSSTVLPPGYEAYIQQHYAQQQFLAQQQLLQQGGGGGLQQGGGGGLQQGGGIGGGLQQGGGIGAGVGGGVGQFNQGQFNQFQQGNYNQLPQGTFNQQFAQQQGVRRPVTVGGSNQLQQNQLQTRLPPQQHQSYNPQGLIPQQTIQRQPQNNNRPNKVVNSVQEDYYEDNDDK